MSIGRLLLFGGSVSAAAGAAGLIYFGKAPLELFDALTVRITDRGIDPLPKAIGHFLPSAVCALLFAAGLVAACAGLGMPSRRHSITMFGRVLVVVGGAGVALAGVPIAMGLFGMRAAFHVIATSATAPNPDDLQEAVDGTVPLVTAGYVILLIATIMPILSTLFGFRDRPTARWLAIVPLAPALLAALSGLCYTLLFVLSWQASVALENLFWRRASAGARSRRTAIGDERPR